MISDAVILARQDALPRDLLERIIVEFPLCAQVFFGHILDRHELSACNQRYPPWIALKSHEFLPREIIQDANIRFPWVGKEHLFHPSDIIECLQTWRPWAVQFLEKNTPHIYRDQYLGRFGPATIIR